MISTLIRLALTVGLIVLVGRESGPWTASAVALLAIANELNAWSIRWLQRFTKGNP